MADDMTKRGAAFAILAMLLTVSAVSACSEETVEPAERIRAIKPYYVVEPAGGDVRRYSGTISASNSSALSFSISGTVQSVEVDQGDRVTSGQVLATLDPQSFALDVSAAQSELQSAIAAMEESELNLDRQRQLYERGWVAEAALDQATAAFDAARGQVSLARSRLGLAERDRANTRLTAPFDGVISMRDVEPFTEVSAGRTVFLINSEGALEVDLSVPDSVVGRLTVGAPVAFETSTVPGCGCTGRVTAIGVAAEAANTVDVTAAILEGPQGLLPGMAVEASLALSDGSDAGGFMVPLVAIAPGDEAAQGYVFKFDAAAGVVNRVPIAGEGVVSGNLISVSEGLEAGDIIAAAGVSFLRDGQAVVLLDDTS